MTDTFSLVADRASARVLRTPDDRFRVSATVWTDAYGTQLHVRAFLAPLAESNKGRGGHYHLLLDNEGRVILTAVGPTEDEAAARLKERAATDLGAQLPDDDDGEWLECSDGSRSVMYGLDGRLELRAKAHVPEVDDEEEAGESLIRLRVHAVESMHFEVAVQAYGCPTASARGRTDADAYNRIRGELARLGIELD
jgi:hypothetical protein